MSAGIIYLAAGGTGEGRQVHRQVAIDICAISSSPPRQCREAKRKVEPDDGEEEGAAHVATSARRRPS